MCPFKPRPWTVRAVVVTTVAAVAVATVLLATGRPGRGPRSADDLRRQLADAEAAADESARKASAAARTVADRDRVVSSLRTARQGISEEQRRLRVREEQIGKELFLLGDAKHGLLPLNLAWREDLTVGRVGTLSGPVRLVDPIPSDPPGDAAEFLAGGWEPVVLIDASLPRHVPGANAVIKGVFEVVGFATSKGARVPVLRAVGTAADARP